MSHYLLNKPTHSQTAESRNIQQVPQAFGLAMILIGISAPLTSAETQPKASGSAGVIGKCRRFEAGKGINCGESITTMPDHPTHAHRRKTCSEIQAFVGVQAAVADRAGHRVP